MPLLSTHMTDFSSNKRGTRGGTVVGDATGTHLGGTSAGNKFLPKPKSAAPGASHEVRIIGGSLKRSKLAVVSAQGLRPTPNRVRETLFNWLGNSLEGLNCVDMFAGTGALGIEAASRGASHVLLIENNAAAARTLEQNIARLKASACELRQSDAFMALRSLPAQSVDLIFVDPPFDSKLHARAAVAAKHALKVGGLLYLEAPDEATIQAQTALGYELYKLSKAGAVSFALLINSNQAAPS
jgi:16S rRNA (guanine966-N2)-methyltransferase